MSDYPRFREALAEALDPRLFSIDHLDHLLLSMRAQAWFSERAAIVTEVREYPTGAKVLHGLVAAGELREIVEILIPRAEQWARSLGCLLAVIESRQGWGRALRRHGYEPHQLALRKEL